jgi:F-type H+-transporting ATPase subunit b
MTETHQGINLVSNFGKILNFAILFFLLYLLAKSPLSKYLKNKRDSTIEEIEDSFRKKDEIERRLRELEERIKNVDLEIKEIISNGEKEALSEREKILNEAKKEADKIISEAEEAIEDARRKGIEELKRYGAELLIERAIEKVKRNFGESEQRKILRKAINELGKSI